MSNVALFGSPMLSPPMAKPSISVLSDIPPIVSAIRGKDRPAQSQIKPVLFVMYFQASFCPLVSTNHRRPHPFTAFIMIDALVQHHDDV